MHCSWCVLDCGEAQCTAPGAFWIVARHNALLLVRFGLWRGTTHCSWCVLDCGEVQHISNDAREPRWYIGRTLTHLRAEGSVPARCCPSRQACSHRVRNSRKPSGGLIHRAAAVVRHSGRTSTLRPRLPRARKARSSVKSSPRYATGWLGRGLAPCSVGSAYLLL